jgi:hypothetical protein
MKVREERMTVFMVAALASSLCGRQKSLAPRTKPEDPEAKKKGHGRTLRG